VCWAGRHEPGGVIGHLQALAGTGEGRHSCGSCASVP